MLSPVSPTQNLRAIRVTNAYHRVTCFHGRHPYQFSVGTASLGATHLATRPQSHNHVQSALGSSSVITQAMDYETWNRLLAAHFFYPGMNGRQVLLHVTPELLESLAAKETKGKSTREAAVADFCRAVSSHGRWDICQEVCKWVLDDDWRDEQLEFPPYLAFLSAFVLALTIDEGPLINKKGSGYYGPLNSLLKRNGYKGTEVNSSRFGKTRQAWENLEVWSVVTKAGTLGCYKFRSVGGWVHVGMPAAQALVRAEDRTKIDGLFERYDRGQALTAERLRQDLKSYPAYLATTTRDLLFEGDDGVRSTVAELLLELWEEYKSRPPTVRIPPKRRTSVPVAGAGDSRPSVQTASASVLLASLQDYNSGQDVLCLAIRLEDADTAPEEFQVLHGGRQWTAERFRQDGGTHLYGPIYSQSETAQVTDYLLFGNAQQEFRIEFKNGAFVLTEEDTDEPAAFLEAEPEGSAVEWLQTDPGRLEIGSHYRLLVRSAPGIAALLDANSNSGDAVREVGYKNAPEGCRVYALAVHSLANLGLPTPAATAQTGLRLVGGIRSCEGAGNRYFFFAPPSVECDASPGVAVNTANGGRHQLKRPKDQNRFALPAELRIPGELLFAATGSDGYDAPRVARVTMSLVEPEIAGELPGVAITQFAAGPPGRQSGAFLEGLPDPPPYLFDPTSLSVQFLGGEQLPGSRRCYRPGQLPRVALPPGCPLGVELDCDSRVVPFGDDGVIDLTGVELRPGRHLLKLLWCRTPVGRAESFQIRETPDFQLHVDGACKLDGAADGAAEYLLQSETVRLDVEPADRVEVKINGGKFEVLPLDLTPVLTKEVHASVELYWRNHFAEQIWLHFVRDHPKVEVSLVPHGPQIPGLFPRHALPDIMAVVEPERERANITFSCGGAPCVIVASESRCSIPKETEPNKLLTITCRWRGVEIPCRSPQFRIVEAPAVALVPNGGKPAGAGAFFKGKLPSVTVTPPNPQIEVLVNGSAAMLDERGLVQNLEGLAAEGPNTIIAQWFAKEIATLTFKVVVSKFDKLELTGGLEIAPGEYLLSCDQDPLPEVIGCPPGGQIFCNAKPLPDNRLTADLCRHGENVLHCDATPGKKRFVVWKDIWLLGAQQGEIREPAPGRQAAPPSQESKAWSPVWVIFKGRTLRAAVLPGADAAVEPVPSSTQPRRLKRDWSEKIREAQLVASQPEVRGLWKKFAEKAKGWK